MSAAVELSPGPEPYLATCERCGERIPALSPRPLPFTKFLAEIEAVRERHTSCLRSLRDQCEAAGVAYFNKQLGSKPVAMDVQTEPIRGYRDRHGGNPDEWPEDLRRREWPVS